MNPEKIKEDFPIFEERPKLTYLDNAATSQKPRQVIEAVAEFYSRNNSNTGRGLYKLANDASQAYEESRKTIAEFINAEKKEIVFVRNTTEAQNLLASTLKFEGDIVLSEMAHHSEQLPWRRKAKNENKEIDYLHTSNGKISLENVKEKINEDTGLVAISHISNVFGAENPVKKIVEIAHEHDALVVLDCAQSAPHIPINVKQLKADFITFSGHKMMGPTGIGVLYGRKALLEDMKPYQVGGGMVGSVTKNNVKYSKPPHKFEAGTQNIAGAIGLEAAVNYLQDLGLEKVKTHDKQVSQKIRENLNKIEEVELLSPNSSILVSFKVRGAHPHDVAEILGQNQVAVRAGNHCAQPLHEELDMNGTVRASPYAYNTESDAEKLAEAVKEAAKLFN